MKMSDNDILMQELSRVFLLAYRQIDRAMTERGASLSRTKVLIYIERRAGQANAASIAELFDLAPRTVTQTLDALERDGLVMRVADPSDRRVKRLAITDEGRNAIAATEPLRHELMDELCRFLTDDDRRQLLAGLKKISTALQ